MTTDLLDLRPEIADALQRGRPVVALESTLIAHGLPWPQNLHTALAAESAVLEAGAIPATIAVLAGRPTIGLYARELEALAVPSARVRKASCRDLAACIATKADAATTVAATMRLAHLAGVRVFATGGIGGVHPGAPSRGVEDSTPATQGAPSRVAGAESSKPRSAPGAGGFDISADLIELGRTPVAVVCAGAKSILDLAATLEVLETQGVPVLGFGSDTFAAFYLRSSGLTVSARVDTPAEVAAVLTAHWRLGGAGVVVSLPLPEESALAPEEFAGLLAEAEEQARKERIHGPALTPFLLGWLATLSEGRTLRANHELIVANARLAGCVAGELSRS